jgi:patatin-like phospholipase/acyl hydrolase
MTMSGVRPHRFQILSLDGGGIRGVFTAAMLASIEEDHSVRIADHFDLIAGTSTGGIIAIALGLGIRPREILDFYIEHGPRIFANRLGWRSVLHWTHRKYSGIALERALKSILGDKAFGESAKRLVIPAYNIAANDVYIFRTPHLEILRRDYRVPAWQVAMATGSAPTYFPAFAGLDHLRLVDGGVWANNPSMVAYVEAVGSLRVPAEQVSMLSIGTMTGLRTYAKGLDRSGKLGWAKHVSTVIMDATSTGINNQVHLLLGDDRYLRVNAVASERSVALDRINTVDDLIAYARHDSRKAIPHISRMFLNHSASPFEPLYRNPEQ